MKQIDWVKELEEKKKKKKTEVIECDNHGWYKYYIHGTNSATSYNRVYYTDTGTGSVF